MQNTTPPVGVQVSLGRFDEGLANIHDGMELYRGLRSPLVFWPMLLFIAASASHRAGRHAEGLGPIDSAIEAMSQGRGTTLLPELHLLKGDLLAALAEHGGTSDRDGAAAWYQLAFDRASELDARISRLRAATRLGRLALAAGRPETVAPLLGPLYATFAEGLATADLVEARDLLAAASRG